MSTNVLWNILIFTAWLSITVSALSQNDKVQKLQQEIKSQAKKIQSQEKTIQDQGNMIKKLEKEYQGIENCINILHPTESCSILQRKRPSTLSGVYTIYPKGLNTSVKVHCDMSSKNGVGVTEIGHDSELRTRVSGYEAPGSYNRKIKYDLPMEQIVAIIQQSQWCEQYIKYECHHTKMWLYTEPYSWWVSRKGAQMKYWGGAAVDSGKCACGITNSCAGGGRCNCEMNDNKLREDSGYLRDKDTLPVTELRFGESGESRFEYGYHTLGKLRCWD